ncbi:TFIID-31kDa-domain-containing protein [Hesseltinella vesiculosa]|uniref:TFIID-31kDa-domain-containing protein n=1 Tax=Hesseltinella vesiculosa TaxID=101127 RepID=A0A1X2G6Q0_9FUNG|nr:TFIID-31kDa-domain-containing protein [Hesseltinella vesiculosa]
MSTKKREQANVQPPDATVVSLVLQSLGIQEYDPKVVQQLLEFAHRYTADVFQDALVYAEHASKNEIDIDDIQLAIQGRVNHSFTNPPPKEFLLELAEEKNKTPLPLIPDKFGNRLPADKYCLTGLNFSIAPSAPPPPMTSLPKVKSQPSGSPVDPPKRRRDEMEDEDYDF